jgi:hypothetical protein
MLSIFNRQSSFKKHLFVDTKSGESSDFKITECNNSLSNGSPFSPKERYMSRKPQNGSFEGSKLLKTQNVTTTP